jgi:hypothetical protein
MRKRSDQSLGKLADAAFRQAADKVIERAEKAGTPVISWENGKVVKLDPRKLRLEREKKRQNRKRRR